MTTTNTKFYSKMDAGEQREYIGYRYGQLLVNGGVAYRYFAAVRLVERLARRLGDDFENVLQDIRNDWTLANND